MIYVTSAPPADQPVSTMLKQEWRHLLEANRPRNGLVDSGFNKPIRTPSLVNATNLPRPIRPSNPQIRFCNSAKAGTLLGIFNMMLVVKTEDAEAMTANAPFGPGFSPVEARKAEVMEVYCTIFTDLGEECIFLLRDSAGRVVGEKRMQGY